MDWYGVLQFILKLLIIYIVALTVVRWMGKRALGTLGLFDLVVMAGIGDVIVMVGLEQRVPLQKGLLILGLLGGLEYFFSLLAYRSPVLASYLEGKPTLLIKDGTILEGNLANEHISMADLRQELRKQGVSRVSQVSQAVLEACGKFSVIIKDEAETVSNQDLLQEISALRYEIEQLKEAFLVVKER